MMNPKRHPPVPLAITQISSHQIVLTSTRDAALPVRFLAVSGSFLTVLGILQGLNPQNNAALSGISLILLGLACIFLSGKLRHGAYEIYVNGDARLIAGLKNFPENLEFSRILSIALQPEPRSNLWGLELEIDGIAPVTLVKDYPFELVMFLGSHLSYLIARPFKLPRTISTNQIPPVKWTLPYKAPVLRFPLEWGLISAGLAAFVALLLDFNSLNFASFLFWPKWVSVLLVTLAGTQPVSSAYLRYGLRAGANSCAGAILLVILVAWIALVYPAPVLLGLIPGICILLISIPAIIRKKHFIPWIASGVALVFAGIPFSYECISTFHYVRTLDPGIIEKIEISNHPTDGNAAPRNWIIERPEEIRSFMKQIHDLTPQKNDRIPRSGFLDARISRPLGKPLRLKLQHQGAGMSAIAVADMRDSYLGFEVDLGSLASAEMDAFLFELSSNYEFWPPR
jgi:hypothetical protein